MVSPPDPGILISRVNSCIVAVLISAGRVKQPLFLESIPRHIETSQWIGLKIEHGS